jgi:hypothetical protein
LEPVVKSSEVVKSLQPNPVVKNESLQPTILQPCLRCSELENQLEAVATLPTTYIDEREAELKEKHRKEIEKLKKEFEARVKDLEKENSPYEIR